MEYKQNISWYKNDYLYKSLAKKESLHYNFYFLKNSLAEKDIKKIVKLKEKHYKKILSWLNLNNTRKIDYYIYSSLKEKSSLMGDNSPGNAIWKKLNTSNVPQKFEIHCVYNKSCKFIGEHEDTHLLSLPWGLSIYLFCEGLSQYMENNFMGEKLNIAAIKLLKNGNLYPIRYLYDNKNWENVKQIIIYPQAGSFTKFLIKKYGKNNFKHLYQNTSRKNTVTFNLLKIKKIYRKDIKQLEEEWINYLKTTTKS
ncbi:MAG TPA: hypothetical protein PLD14_00960 [Candidatus Pacearchaeota archaeon]|mgnify:CR=1 FL=1|nr:hypothetical protein [Candidatus Pacearchaeota archaeon]HPR79769.1 hypothetical protein [Candidatus Pacearchaeota archaeon]